MKEAICAIRPVGVLAIRFKGKSNIDEVHGFLGYEGVMWKHHTWKIRVNGRDWEPIPIGSYIIREVLSDGRIYYDYLDESLFNYEYEIMNRGYLSPKQKDKFISEYLNRIGNRLIAICDNLNSSDGQKNLTGAVSDLNDIIEDIQKMSEKSKSGLWVSED